MVCRMLTHKKLNHGQICYCMQVLMLYYLIDRSIWICKGWRKFGEKRIHLKTHTLTVFVISKNVPTYHDSYTEDTSHTFIIPDLSDKGNFNPTSVNCSSVYEVVNDWPSLYFIKRNQ